MPVLKKGIRRHIETDAHLPNTPKNLTPDEINQIIAAIDSIGNKGQESIYCLKNDTNHRIEADAHLSSASEVLTKDEINQLLDAINSQDRKGK